MPKVLLAGAVGLLAVAVVLLAFIAYQFVRVNPAINAVESLTEASNNAALQAAEARHAAELEAIANNVAKNELHALAVMVDLYQYEFKRLPDSLADLYQKPATAPDGWYAIKERPNLPDPWGVDYHYTHSGDTFEVRSAGSDKILGTTDDIVGKL